MKEKQSLLLNYLENHLDYKQAQTILNLPFDEFNDYLYFLYPDLKGSDKYFNQEQMFKIYTSYDCFFEDVKKRTLSYFAYPLLLLLIAFVFSLILLTVLIPHVEGLFQSYIGQSYLLKVSQGISGLGILVIGSLMITSFCMGLLLTSSYSMLTIIFFSKFSLVKQFLTLALAKSMNLFLSMGYSEAHLFSSLRKEAPRVYICWLSYYPDLDFKEGVDFFDLYYQEVFDERFSILMKNVSLSHPLNFWLDTYIQMSQTNIVLQLKKISQNIKFMAMAYLLVLVALFYQIMYLPMKMMEVL